MPTEKNAIAEALKSLDHTKDELWTDDGSPLVAEIQRLTNDKTITRAQINDALPGFARKTTESIEEPADEIDDKDDFGDPVVAAIAAEGNNGLTAAAPPAPLDPNAELTEADEYDRLRLIAKGRVTDAETAVTAAKAAIADAQTNLRNAEGRLTRALMLYASKYPAISAAANIKQHLESQQKLLHERVTGRKFEPNAAQNPVDVTLMDRKRDNGRNGKSHQQPTAFLPRRAAVNY